MAVSKFENGHYRPKVTWVPFDGHDYGVYWDGDDAIAVKVLVAKGGQYHKRRITMEGQIGREVIDIARKIRAGEIVV